MQNATIVHVPNEPEHFTQHGFRDAFKRLESTGRLASYHAYSLLREVRRGRAGPAHDEVVELVRAVKPDAIFFQHVDGMSLTKAWLSELRQAAPSAQIVYHEGDAYGKGKPLPIDAETLATNADIVFTPGRSTFMETFRRFCANVYYVPHAWDQARFTPKRPDERQRNGVVMICNRVRSRAWWRRMPGAQDRERLGRWLQKEAISPRTAIYGRGWTGRFVCGELDYDKQLSALQNYQVSVNWDYFPEEAAYFSDRLPISLLSGPHVSTLHPGLEWLPGQESGLFLEKSPKCVIDTAKALLRESPEYRTAMAERGRDWTTRNLSQYRIVEYMLGCTGLLNVPLEDFPWWY